MGRSVIALIQHGSFSLANKHRSLCVTPDARRTSDSGHHAAVT
jgi:hypothetical protein